MARERKEEAPAGAPMWLATYGDMMTLVLCFFVLLYSFSVLDESKFKEFADYFNNQNVSASDSIFGGATGITGLLGNGIIDFPTPSESGAIKDEVDDEKNKSLEGYIDEMVGEMQRVLTEAYASPYETYTDVYDGTPPVQMQVPNVTFEGQRLKIELPSDFLFDSGSATLKAGFDIKTLAEILLDQYQTGYTIIVEGHTDNVPQSAGRSSYKNNWDLSGGRAAEVITSLVTATGLDESCFELRGKADTEPVADNGTAEGRAQNRRVVIYIQQPAFLGGIK